MPDDNNPSSGAGATPPAGSPATGTPASGGATPPKPAATLEEALARIAELEHAHKNASEERDRHRKKLSVYEEAEKKAQEARLSETERLNKQYSDLQTAYADLELRSQKRVISAEVQLQAAALGIVHPEKVARLIDTSELEFEEDGTPKNAKALIEKLLKEMPELTGEKQQPGQPAKSGAPPLPVMSPEKGRTSFGPGQQAQPGRIPRLTDPGMFKT